MESHVALWKALMGVAAKAELRISGSKQTTGASAFCCFFVVFFLLPPFFFSFKSSKKLTFRKCYVI